MRATRFCAYAQPPHTAENAAKANASLVAHSVRALPLRLTREAASRRYVPIRLPLTSSPLSIARSPPPSPGESAYVERKVGNPHVDLRGGNRRRRRLDAGSRDLEACGLEACRLDVCRRGVRAAALLELQSFGGVILA